MSSRCPEPVWTDRRPLVLVLVAAACLSGCTSTSDSRRSDADHRPTAVATTVKAADPTASPSTQPAARVLRVAADPNNLPFSNERREGFENRIAELVARDLGLTVEYAWRAQRRGFFREALRTD